MSRARPQFRQPTTPKRKVGGQVPFSRNSAVVRLVRDPASGELVPVPARKSRRPR